MTDPQFQKLYSVMLDVRDDVRDIASRIRQVHPTEGEIRDAVEQLIRHSTGSGVRAFEDE